MLKWSGRQRPHFPIDFSAVDFRIYNRLDSTAANQLTHYPGVGEGMGAYCYSTFRSPLQSETNDNPITNIISISVVSGMISYPVGISFTLQQVLYSNTLYPCARWLSVSFSVPPNLSYMPKSPTLKLRAKSDVASRTISDNFKNHRYY